jgi:hypothetical protein
MDQAMMGNMMGNASMNQQMNQPMHVSRSGQNMMPMGQMGGIPTSVTIQHGQNPMQSQMLGNQTNMQQGSQHYNH